MRLINKAFIALNTPVRVAVASLVAAEIMTVCLMLIFNLRISWQVFIIAAISGFVIAFGVAQIIFRYQRTLEVQKQALQVITVELQEAKDELEVRVRTRTESLALANKRIQDALDEKNVLLKEIHHRVKNNLQIVSSLLSLQARGIEDSKAVTQFNEAQNRIQSMVLIHERLYMTENLAQIDYDDYVQNLVDALRRSFGGESVIADVSIDINDLILDVDMAVPCGLIITELVSNAYKHAFQGEKDAAIKIKMSKEGNTHYFLVVSDNGVGLPDNFDRGADSNIGLQIVNSLVRQLKGSMRFEHNDGTEVRILFPAG